MTFKLLTYKTEKFTFTPWRPNIGVNKAKSSKSHIINIPGNGLKVNRAIFFGPIYPTEVQQGWWTPIVGLVNLSCCRNKLLPMCSAHPQNVTYLGFLTSLTSKHETISVDYFISFLNYLKKTLIFSHGQFSSLKVPHSYLSFFISHCLFFLFFNCCCLITAVLISTPLLYCHEPAY